MNKITDQKQAQKILSIIEKIRAELERAEGVAGGGSLLDFAGEYNFDLLSPLDDALTAEGVEVYGNKGRNWTRTACLPGLDYIKGQCNPRLAFNNCSVLHIGCPDCMATLKKLAEGVI